MNHFLFKDLADIIIQLKRPCINGWPWTSRYIPRFNSPGPTTHFRLSFFFVSNRRFDSVGLPIKPGSPETSGGKYEDVLTKLGKDVWNGSKCLQLPLDPPKRRDDWLCFLSRGWSLGSPVPTSEMRSHDSSGGDISRWWVLFLLLPSFKGKEKSHPWEQQIFIKFKG